MPTTKKSKVTTEVSPIADESVQESPEQSRASNGQAMYDRACAKERELAQDRNELMRSIQEHQSEVEQRLTQIQTAVDACATCEQKRDELGGQISRQRLRLETYKQTGSEAEHAAILEGLMSAYEIAEEDLAESIREKEELESGRPIIEELRKCIEEEKETLAEVTTQLEEIKIIGQEAWSQVGRDRMEAHRAKIQTIQDELKALERAIPVKQAELRDAQNFIRQELKDWPAFITNLELSHGPRLAEDEKCTPIEHLFFAHIVFIRALHKWGPKLNLFTAGLQGKYKIYEALSLHQNLIADLMSDRPWSGRTVKDAQGIQRWEDVCPTIEADEMWIEEERKKSRPQDTIGVPMGTWSAPRGPI